MADLTEQQKFDAMYPQEFLDTLRLGVGDGSGIDPGVYQMILDKWLTPKFENRNIFDRSTWDEKKNKAYDNTIAYLSSVNPQELSKYFKSAFNKPVSFWRIGKYISQAPKGTKGKLDGKLLMSLITDDNYNFKQGGQMKLIPRNRYYI